MLKAEEISKIISQEIQNFDSKMEISEIGTVLSVGDGVARVYGLEKAQAGEIVEFENGTKGLILNLEEVSVGIAIMSNDTSIKEGFSVKRTYRIADVSVGNELLGRVFCIFYVFFHLNYIIYHNKIDVVGFYHRKLHQTKHSCCRKNKDSFLNGYYRELSMKKVYMGRL